MKKHEIIYKNEKGELCEGFLISDKSARTLKAENNIPGLVAITSTSRVNHPSPAIMCATLAALGVDLTNFYTMAETLKNTPETPDESEAE